ncbi:MAG: hypothetical protein MUF10_20855, partial [Thermoanaerobaculaceae bacterium]|nr:hypothetical protein [Thermoanaerobaculaceae bacterium]
MGKRVLAIVAVVLGLGGAAGASSPTATESRYSVVISNEAPGHLVDRLIAAGHGSQTLFQVLQYLQPLSGGAIPASFVTKVAGAGAGSSVFSDTLEIYAGVNGGIEIADDGTVSIPSLLGQDYDGHPGYLTHVGTATDVGSVTFTSASGVGYYIYTHAKNYGGGVRKDYYAFAIVWKGADTPARLFPGIASVAGSTNTRWRSEGVLANPTTAAAEAKLELIPRDAAAVTATV